MTTTIYATRREATEQAIAPALGEYGEDYDIDAIADEALVWHDGLGANPAHPNDYSANAQGYSCIEGDEFWAAVERHDRAAGAAHLKVERAEREEAAR